MFHNAWGSQGQEEGQFVEVVWSKAIFLFGKVTTKREPEAGIAFLKLYLRPEPYVAVNPFKVTSAVDIPSRQE